MKPMPIDIEKVTRFNRIRDYAPVLMRALQQILGELDFDLSEHTHAERNIRNIAEKAISESLGSLERK